MILHIHPTKHSAAKLGHAWEPSVLPASTALDAVIVSLSAAPPGKHDLSMCAGYEEAWRKLAPEVMCLLKDDRQVSFVWASGPVEWDMILRVFPYIVSFDTSINRYHIEGLTCVRTDSYTHTRVCYEFNKKSFVAMMEDQQLDLEYTRLYAAMFEERFIEEVIAKPFWDVGLRWIVEHNAIAVAPKSHFEGCYVLGARELVDAAIARVLRSDIPCCDGRPG